MGVWLSAMAAPASVPPVLASCAASPFASGVAPLPASRVSGMPPLPPVAGPPAPPEAVPPVPCASGPAVPPDPPLIGEAQAMTRRMDRRMVRFITYQSSTGSQNCEVVLGRDTSLHGTQRQLPRCLDL